MKNISPAEMLVLERIALYGECNKTIGNELGITDGTVKQHMKALFRKSGCHNRTQLIIWAFGKGIVAPSQTLERENVVMDFNAYMDEARQAVEDLDRIYTAIGRCVFEDPSLLTNSDYLRLVSDREVA